MRKSAHSHRTSPYGLVLIVEAVGFLLIILSTWIDEGLIFQNTMLTTWLNINDWREPILETIEIVVIAIPVLFLTNRLMRRLTYLENFLRVCAWCHRLDLSGNWVAMEDYFNATSHLHFTHGICLDCAKKMEHVNLDKTEAVPQDPAASDPY